MHGCETGFSINLLPYPPDYPPARFQKTDPSKHKKKFVKAIPMQSDDYWVEVCLEID